MISCLFSLCCQRLQMVAFVCLKAPFDTPVHLLYLSFLNLLLLMVGVPRTQHFITCRCDRSSLSATLRQWFPLPSALTGPGTYWKVWCWIPPVSCYQSEERCCTPSIGLSSQSSSSSVWASTMQPGDGGLRPHLPLAWHVLLEEFFEISSQCTCDQSDYLSSGLVIPHLGKPKGQLKSVWCDIFGWRYRTVPTSSPRVSEDGDTQVALCILRYWK